MTPPAPALRRGVAGRFADLGISLKILVALLLLSAVALGSGLIAVTRLAKVDAASESIYTANVLPLTHLAATQSALLRLRLDLRDLALATTSQQRTALLASVTTDSGAVDDASAAYAPHSADPVGFAKFAPAWRAYHDAVTTSIVPAAAAGDLTAFRLRSASARPSAVLAQKVLEEASTAEGGDAARSVGRANATYHGARTLVITVLLIGVGLALALGLAIARSIVRPLRDVSRVLRALAEGDLTASAGLSSRDEVGRMSADLDTALGSLRRTVDLLSANSTTLAASAEELSATNDQIAASAEQTSAQAAVVAGAAEEVNSNVQTVATGAEQMGASIREIAQNANEAARVAADAVASAATTNQAVAELGESSTEIGAVVKVITSIAEQTNLLALNATIEAARAGEAGKGFAVVANEVKELAQETAKATEDISRKIEAIQGSTAGAVAAITHIGSVIGQISDYTTTIASAVEEQTATTSEMARSVGEAAAGSGQIAENIGGVAQAASATTAGVGDSQTATNELARMATQLQDTVRQFRTA